MQPSFDSLPGIRPTAEGHAMYERGRALVAAGLDPSHLVWDADEVLWDWALSGLRLVGGIPAAIFGRLGHREYIAIRPGVIELLWGLHHGALEHGRDPHLRIWTSGYPWRLWRILREIQGFDALLGPPFALASDDDSIMHAHPRVFTRLDYVAVMSDLLDRERRAERLAALPELPRKTIATQLEQPDDSGFKIPELALLAGKPAFSAARVLIDDVRRNVEWFNAAGRSAVHVVSTTPRIVFGKIRNSAWAPERFLAESGDGITAAIADALAKLAGNGHAPTIAIAARDAKAEQDERAAARAERPAPPHIFAIDVPNDKIWREWISPMRQLRKKARAV